MSSHRFDSSDVDLSARTSLAIGVMDGAGTYLSSSAANTARLGRSLDEIIGRNWRDWQPARETARKEPNFARVVAGHTVTDAGWSLRPDGRVVVSRCHMFATTMGRNKPAVVAIHSGIVMSERGHATLSGGSLDIMAYTADVAAVLAGMASEAGLAALATSLEEVTDTLARLACQGRLA